MIRMWGDLSIRIRLLRGGVNLYLYGGNPIGWIDPFGLCSTKLGENMGARRGDEMANHHLMSEEIMKDSEFKELFANAKSSGFNGDGASNGIFLPGNQGLAEQTGLPGHWSNHSQYTDAIRTNVSALNDQFQAGKLSDTQVVLGLGKIQSGARTGLESGAFSVNPTTGKLN